MKKYTNHIVWTLVILNLLWFVYTLWQNCINLPFLRDDTIFFLNTFHSGYIEADNFLDKIKYLFTAGVRPHPKIIGRVASILCYEMTGEINFRWLTFFGSLMIIPIWWVVTRFDKSPMVRLISCLLIVTPMMTHIWSVAIYSYYGHALFLLLAFYFMGRHKILMAGVSALVCSLSIANGWLIFIFLIVHIVISNAQVRFHNKTIWRDLLLLLPFFMVSLLITYLITNVGFDESSLELSRDKLKKALVTRPMFTLNSFLNFLFQSLTDIFQAKNIMHVLLGISWITLMLAAIKFRRKFIVENKEPLLIVSYILIMAIVASISRLLGNFDRYIIFSSIFIVTSIIFFKRVFVQSASSSAYRLIIVGIFSVFLLNSNVDRAKQLSEQSKSLNQKTVIKTKKNQKRQMNRLKTDPAASVLNNTKHTVMKNKILIMRIDYYQNIYRAMELNIYKPEID